MKKLLVAASGLAFGLAIVAWRRARPPEVAPEVPPQPDPATVTRNLLLYYIIPLWSAAGVADWLCHRRTNIENTTGAKESLIHLLMLAEMGTPVLAGLFLEITPPVLGGMIGAFFLHEATALWDVGYAVTRREVTPVEQHVHSFLELVPLMAVSFICVLHWRQVRALIGREVPLGAPIRFKHEPLPRAYLAGALGSMGLLEGLPYLEELWRDWRAHPGQLVPSEARDAAS
ncbi:MAG: hypothetical protein ACM33T_16095 [Solirubrobacterales bacterium]